MKEFLKHERTKNMEVIEIEVSEIVEYTSEEDEDNLFEDGGV